VETLLYISAFLVSVAVLILAACCVPFLLESWRAARNIAATLQTLNENLPGILADVQEIASSYRRTAATVNREVEELAEPVQRVRCTLSDLSRDFEYIVQEGVRLPLWKRLKDFAALQKGLGAFLEAYRHKG
jgi:uncharacterized protein YoxC